MNKILMYDFEVFSGAKFWCVVIIDYDTREKTVVINDEKQLKNIYKNNQNAVWVGFNSRMYDQWIFKAILLDYSPFKMNDEIIYNDKNGYHLLKNVDTINFNNFDIYNNFHSLKQLEAFMGSTIKESNVPFDIKRKLTEQEIEEVLQYCTHDVEQTIEVFENRKEEFDSQFSLIEAFNLPMSMFNKTKAQLSAHVLGTVRQHGRNDEFNLTLPDTLKISDKYQYIVDWYKKDENKDYKKKLYTDVAGVPHIFAWGGLHGAINNYSNEGIILCCDVASLYPSIMIEYGYISRNVTNSDKYKEIRDTRLKLKAEKNPMQLPYKIVLNSTYGAMKDKHNDLYDPLMANNVCAAGQLLLLDLIDKIEPYCELIQSNTDGLFVKVENMETVDKIKEVAKEWEQRTRLDLEWDIFSKIYQKDVNNYIIINEEGKYKSKGAYVKKLNNIDYDLPIVNNALINYFVSGQSVEDTINQCNNLREFQKIVKISKLYKYALHGEKQIKEKVLRVFASKNENAPGVFKVKTEDRIEKIANTPEKCFIYNDNVKEVTVPDELDREYYIEIARKRLNDFLDAKSTNKINKIPSDIKYIKEDVKQELLEYIDKDYDNFIDFLVDITENSSANTKQIEILIKLNYLKKWGRNKKLYDIYQEFKNQYKKTHKEKTKLERIELLYDVECNIDDMAFSLQEQMQFDLEYYGELKTIYDLPKGTCYVLELDTKYSPRAKVYGLATGKTSEVKVLTKLYKKNPFKINDIVQFSSLKKKPKMKCVDGKFVPITGEYDIWSDSWKILKLT